MMGNLTDDMTRLCGEIVSLRNDREFLMAELASGARDLTDFVASMQADFCDARKKMAKKTKSERVAFVSGVKKKVMRMRKETNGDLAGARRAWSGKRK
jgi:KaiC/GvpD/RAD55 family RecA-like ATPase